MTGETFSFYVGHQDLNRHFSGFIMLIRAEGNATRYAAVFLIATGTFVSRSSLDFGSFF
jgi:hypothetical protein